MSKYWNEKTKSLEPYTPGEQFKDRKYLKLNTNENPYPPSPLVMETLRQAVNSDLRLYPDPNSEELRATIAGYHGLSTEQVFIGNGSDEILAFAFAAFFSPGREILFPDITYSFYPVYADLFSIHYRLVPVDPDFNIPVEKFMTGNGGIIIANPNAPTGKCLPPAALRQVIEFNNTLDNVVLIDEAYIDFGGESAVELVHEFPNLLVIQTLSKSRSLAGLRVGFAMGHRQLTEGLYRIKNSINSYTIDRLALAGAEAAFQDEAYFQETRQKIINTRERISRELTDIGFKVIESKANFLFISHPTIRAGDLYARLKEMNVLVRYFNKPGIDNHLRVSIGSDEQMTKFLQILKQLL
ncbi:MAG: histidinol-phosphate transaminase [Syntrophaceae bacterium]|nr:histidinol-phosphate transaminase [Syntrophaceae bacterium]